MARQHGSKGQVLADPAGATAYVAIASLKNWSLNMARDRVDVTAFMDTNKQYVQGLPDIKGDLGGWWDPLTTPDELFAITMGDVAAGLKLVPSSLTPGVFFSGLAYLDAGIEVDAAGAVSVKGSFVGAGDWALATAP